MRKQKKRCVSNSTVETNKYQTPTGPIPTENTINMSNMQPLIQEMTAGLRNSRTQLDSVNQQLYHLERQDKIAQVTEKELSSYPVESVWRSCGKAFILQDKSLYIKDLKDDERTLQEQMKNLKIKQNYLETTVQNTVDSLKKVLEKK